MIKSPFRNLRALRSSTYLSLCLCLILPTLVMGQTRAGEDGIAPNVRPDGTAPIREVPLLETENGFTPQIARPAASIIQAPNLRIVVKEPVEIFPPDLVFVVKEPVEVSAPDLVIVVKEPVTIIAPELVLVIEENMEDHNKDSEEPSDADGIGGATDVDSDTVTGPRICVGEYTVHSPGAMGGGLGPDGVPVPVMPVGTPVMAKATLTTDSCGAFLTMTSQGQSILMARQHGDENVYVGELKMPDGVSRSLQLTCGRGLNMWGALEAKDGNIQVRRPMWLQPVNTSITTLASCTQ